MADESKETIIIDVDINVDDVVNDTAAAIKALSDLKAEQKALNDTIKEGNPLTEEQRKRFAAVGKEIEDVKTRIKSNTAILNENAKSTRESNGSLNEMRQRLKEAQNAYAALSKTEREGKVGEEMQKQIKALHDEVLGLEGGIGQMQRNVGNYNEALAGMEAGLGDVGKSIKDLISGGFLNISKGLSGLSSSVKNGVIPAFKAFSKTLLTSPIGWIAAAIAAVVAVLGKLKDAIKKNDEAGTAFAKLFSTFEPIIDGISAALDKVVGWLGKAANALADWLGGASEASRKAQALVTAMDDLQEAERQYVVNNAARNKEVEELRSKSLNSEKYSVQDRKKFLEEAIELQKKDLQDQLAISKEKLRILEETAKKESDTSDEMKNKIANARAAVLNAETNYNTKTRELKSQLISFNKQITDDEKARTEKLQEEVKKRLELQRKEKEETQKLARELQDAILANMEDGYTKARTQTQVRYEREIADLRSRLENEKDLTSAQREIINDIIIQKQIALNLELQKLDDEEQERIKENLQKKIESQAAALEELRAMAEKEEEEEEERQLDNVPTPEEVAAKLGLTSEGLEYYKELLRNGTESAEAFNLAQEKTAEQLRKQFADTSGSLANAFGEMSELFNNFGDENKKAARASKAFAIAQIATQQGQAVANNALAISAAVQGATTAAAATGPAAPFTLIAYIAEMVALVVSSVAGVVSSIKQAKQIVNDSDAGSYAVGGIVGGVSYSGDRLRANVNSGEMILNKSQQQRLFAIANGSQKSLGFDYGAFADSVAAAVGNLPAPTLVYSEFEKFNKRRVTYNEYTKI